MITVERNKVFCCFTKILVRFSERGKVVLDGLGLSSTVLALAGGTQSVPPARSSVLDLNAGQ